MTVRSTTLLQVALVLAASSGPASAERSIAADLHRVKGPLDTMFKACVGAGRANEGLRADWQRQLEAVHKECGFTCVRMHGLLGDDMGVYREGRDGRPEYNWQYIDELYDFLVRIGMKPFVELSFSPSALASGDKTIFWWRGNVTRPKDPKKWGDLIRALVAHLKERYGDAEVRTWYFEVWNEPNLDAFFVGTQQDYFDLYAVTAKAIKSVSPAYRVGGPATAGCAWIPEFIRYCAGHHVPVDFVSSHDYAVDVGHLDETGNAGTVLSANPRAIYGNVLRMREQIAASPLPKLELHLTEWSASYTPADPVHDSYHSAAFILDKVKNAGAAANSMSYWVFTDIFEEAGPRFTPFHGGFGLLNYQDLRKPAFFAYQFLNRLGPTEIASSDPASYVTTDAAGGVQVLFWDFTLVRPGKTENDQEFYKHDLPAKAKGFARIHLTSVPPGRYTLTLYQVGYRVNDAYAVYKDLGAPNQLTRAQVAKIKAASDGRPVEQKTVTVDADGTFDQAVSLRENDVFLFTLEKRRD
ncbi:MAG TPA: glycoside hydrolase [Polyangia bacterium]|nr:glycoside hydrolase [Polyangia bacterium]